MSNLLEEPARPASEPTYITVTDGALSIEVPAGWSDVLVGAESEAGGSWSQFAGEDPVPSSITATPDLAAWGNTPGVSGTYTVASRILAERYTDDELVAEGPNDLSGACEPGARSRFERPPYSGLVQAWKNCGGNPAASFLTLSASPAGRACVVVLQTGMVGDEDVEAGQHLLDTFEVDCGPVPADRPAVVEEYAYEAEPEDKETTQAVEEQYPEGDISCENFVSAAGYPSQFQAQQFFDANDHSADPYGLDEDGDGFACENLENNGEGPGTTPDVDPPASEPEPPQYEPTTPSVPTDGGEAQYPSPTSPGGSGDLDCEDFSSAEEVQQSVDAGDPHDLDSNNDGSGCEGYF